MTDYSWWPGLIVLAGGLAGGFFMAGRLRRAGKNAKRKLRAQDQALLIQDLEGRRDDLYRRLRDEGEILTESDRLQLERSAARVLRDLESATGGAGKADRLAKATEPPEAEHDVDARPERQQAPSRRPLLTGVALGVGLVAIIALLIYWAVRDTSGTGTVMTSTEDAVHAETALLTAEAQQEYEALRAQLDSDPGDVMARKRLAILLVSNDQFVPAFQEAKALQERDPNDIDGLYVEAVVRIQMGQSEPAVELLDRVLELFPGHVQAHAWRGIVLYRSGDITAAVSSWERGIEAAGGQHPELEEMVRAALAEEAGQEDHSGHDHEDAGPAPMAAAPADWALSAAEEVGGFGVRLELAPGVTAPPGVLFVALRSADGGAPVAVRRISDPGFPLELTLTETDSMMGSALPQRGVIFVRLDQDGDVSAASAGDLAAEAEVEIGSVTTLRLAP